MIKTVVSTICSRILSPYYRLQLRNFTGTYFIKPKPRYISQFVGIYRQSIKLGDALKNRKHIASFGAKDSQEFSFWAWRDCGIACVKMILDSKVGSNKTMMQLTNEGISLGGYILYEEGEFVDKGWFHASLVKLLQKNGVRAKSKKWQSLNSVAADLSHNKCVMLSVTIAGRSSILPDGSFLPQEKATSMGHLLLATGLKMSGTEIEGFFVHDPRGLQNYQNDCWIPAATFTKIFSGRTIVA